MNRRYGAVAGAAVLAVLAADGVRAGPLLKQLSSEIAGTVEKVTPSVVVIRTEATRYYRGYDLYFGRRFMIPETMGGQGSGMIIDKEGHVLTSRHVVAGAQEIKVILNDETSYRARLVGMDANTDLAVLKLEKADPAKLVPMPFGDSAAVRVGEIVLAVGSPFSLQSSATMGIISQKGRSIGALPFEDFIQTDAPINPGNSGGPLVDLEGRMIGVNAVIQTSGASQGNIGIGFAVPANLARRVADSLIKTGRFERPWLGILPEEAAAKDGPSNGPRGLAVAEVYRDTPAARVGLRPGDVLLKAGGQPLNTIQDLQRAILARKIGERIELFVQRGQKQMDFSVPTERMPDFEEEQ